jgi:imidazolonepropionase-like amidohydrolase
MHWAPPWQIVARRPARTLLSHALALITSRELILATANAADLIGDSQDIGSVQAGRHADLIAVNGDPLADITLLENIAFVMKGGVVYKTGGKALAP